MNFSQTTYSKWNSWVECSLTNCGSGERSRTRECTNFENLNDDENFNFSIISTTICEQVYDLGPAIQIESCENKPCRCQNIPRQSYCGIENVQYYFPLNIIQGQVITFACPEGYSGNFSRTCNVKKINKTSNIGVYSAAVCNCEVIENNDSQILLPSEITTIIPNDDQYKNSITKYSDTSIAAIIGIIIFIMFAVIILAIFIAYLLKTNQKFQKIMDKIEQKQFELTPEDEKIEIFRKRKSFYDNRGLYNSELELISSHWSSNLDLNVRTRNTSFENLKAAGQTEGQTLSSNKYPVQIMGHTSTSSEPAEGTKPGIDIEETSEILE